MRQAIESARQHNPKMTGHEARALTAAEAFLDHDLVTAFDMIRQNQEQAPENTWWRHERAWFGLRLNLLRDVVATVEPVDFAAASETPPSWYPGLQLWLMNAYGGLGEYDKLLKIGRQGPRRPTRPSCRATSCPRWPVSSALTSSTKS